MKERIKVWVLMKRGVTGWSGAGRSVTYISENQFRALLGLKLLNARD